MRWIHLCNAAAPPVTDRNLADARVSFPSNSRHSKSYELLFPDVDVTELDAVFGRERRRLKPSISALSRRDLISIRASSSSQARTVPGSFR